MKPFITILLASIALLFANTQVNACDLDPTAVIDVYPGNDVVFFDGDYIYLEAYVSTANCGYITFYSWRVDGVIVSTSAGFEPDFSLQQGEYNRRFDVQLTVGNSGGNTDTVNMTIAIVSESKSYYYLKDHLGSVRVTVNDAGAPVGWDDYYPFGLQMPGRTQNAANSNDNIKFTGYELEQDCETDSSGDCINGVTLGLYHAEARMYDPVIGRFNSVDLMNAKYPSLSPFAYVANNPLVYVDPTGMVIEICNGSGDDDDRNCVTYEAGMEYEGDDTNMGVLINTLNNINSTENGADVVSELIDTDNVYNINISQGIESASFKAETRTITTDSWYAGSAEITSHELFHAYQHEMGSLESSHFKETEALLFGAGVAVNLGERYNPFGKTSNNFFDRTMEALLESQSFNQIHFNAAVARFKESSRANSTGAYNNRPVRHSKNKQLIHRFFPLVRR